MSDTLGHLNSEMPRSYACPERGRRVSLQGETTWRPVRQGTARGPGRLSEWAPPQSPLPTIVAHSGGSVCCLSPSIDHRTLKTGPDQDSLGPTTR